MINILFLIRITGSADAAAEGGDDFHVLYRADARLDFFAVRDAQLRAGQGEDAGGQPQKPRRHGEGRRIAEAGRALEGNRARRVKEPGGRRAAEK